MSRIYHLNSSSSLSYNTSYSLDLMSYRGNLRSNEFLSLRKRTFVQHPDLKASDLFAMGFELRYIAGILKFLAALRLITSYKDSFPNSEGRSYARIHSWALENRIYGLDKERVVILRTELLRLGIIEWDTSYQVGVYSRGYRLAEKYRKGKWIKMEYSDVLEQEVAPLTNKIEYANKYSRARAVRTICSKANDWIAVESYFVNYKIADKSGPLYKLYNAAREVISHIRTPETREFDTFVSKIAAKKQAESDAAGKDVDVYDIYKGRVDAINSGGTYMSFDKRTGRLYSDIANCQKDIRKLLTYKGKALRAVDFVSCQPSLFSLFYTQDAADQAEKKKYIELITKGDIYEFLADGKMTRDESKKSTFKISFGRLYQHQGPHFEKFSSEFPILSQRITDHKRFKGYKSLALEMQAAEASIMIHGSLQELLFEHNIPCASVHDSIMCLDEHVEKVQEVMTRHFTEKMGFCPRIKLD